MRKGQRGKKIGPSSSRAALSPKDRLRQQAYGLRNVRNFAQAKPLLEELYKLEPDNVPLALDLGEAYMETEDFGSATSLYAKLIEKDPKNINAVTNLGGSLIRQGKLSDARSILEYALQLDPKSIHARINLGGVLQASGERKANLDNALEAVQIDPSSSLAFNNLGSAFSDMAMFKEAKHAYETAVILDPNQVDALINLAAVEARLGDSKASAEMYERVLKLLPKEAEQRAEAVKFYAAFEYLKQGVLEKGWDYYEGGFSPLVPANGARTPRRNFGVPRWDGQPLNGKTLMVWREQGLGDELLFCTCLHELKEMGGKVIVECDKRLVEVMARSFPEFTIRAEIFLPQQEGRSPFADFDYHLPAGSLMRHFRPTIESFNRSGAYIKPDPAKVAKFAERLAPYKDDYRLIGICWRSGKLDPVRNLSYTMLDEWAEVLKTQGFKFVNLQYGECEAELKEAEEKYGIEILRWPDLNLRNDLDDIFALMTCLDAVASVQTAVLTMAGCVGAPSVGVKAGGWTALGKRSKSLWFDMLFYAPKHYQIRKTLSLLFQFADIVESPRAHECEEYVDRTLRVLKKIDPASSGSMPDDRYFAALGNLVSSVGAGGLDNVTADAIVAFLVDPRFDEQLGPDGPNKRCSIAFSLQASGFSAQARSIIEPLFSDPSHLSPDSNKDLAVLATMDGRLSFALDTIDRGYSKTTKLLNGYSEIAELLYNLSDLKQSQELFEKDLGLGRLTDSSHFYSLLSIYGLTGQEGRAIDAIKEYLQNKSPDALQNPFSFVAHGAWQATGFSDLPLEIWGLDEKFGLATLDESYRQAFFLRSKADYRGSDQALSQSRYRGNGVFMLFLFDIILGGNDMTPMKTIDSWVDSDALHFQLHPVYQALMGRFDRSNIFVRSIHAKDRLKNKNLFSIIKLISDYYMNLNLVNRELIEGHEIEDISRNRPLAWYLVYKDKIDNENL